MRVTVTVPAYLEKRFEQLASAQGLSNQETFLFCFMQTIGSKINSAAPEPSGPTAHMLDTPDPEVPDLYMMAPPERLRVYTFKDSASCLRGEEIGEYHEIERGDRFAWQKFSRHSKKDAEGWEQGKNGKLCEPCFGIVSERWNAKIRHFSE